MSTSVYKPLGPSFLGRTPDRMVSCRPEVRKVKRVLFEPVDHATTQKFIDEELEKITVSASERWNFDFKREKTLNPNGIYNWRPATPQKTIRPIKRRPESNFDSDFLYSDPGEVIRPIPVRAVRQEGGIKSPSKLLEKAQQENVKPQRLITDFMQVKKRSNSDCVSKKDWSSSIERPAKLPRLSDFSS